MEPNIKKVLVPVDFSDYSKNSFHYAVNFAKFFDAEIILVYVIETILYPPDFTMGQMPVPSIDVEIDKRAYDELEKLAAGENMRKKIKVVVKSGKPFIEIINTALEEDVDLIIIATHGHSGVEHILFGSTADKVIKKAPCPVLTLRDPIKGFSYKESFKK